MTDSIAIDLLSELFDHWNTLGDPSQSRVRVLMGRLRRDLQNGNDKARRRLERVIESAKDRGLTV